MITTDFGDLIAERIRIEHRTLAQRWFERLLDLLPVEARDVFPSESLLDHIPALIVEIAGYVGQPADGAIASNTAILDKARELGELRHAQRASLHQVLREYQILGGVLVAFVLEEIERLGIAPPASVTVLLVNRLYEAVTVLSQSTVEAFVGLYTQTIAEQSERLEQFTRMAAHEWRQPLGALQFAVALLGQRDLDPPRARRALETAARSVQRLVDLTYKLETVARMRSSEDNVVVQEVSAGTIAIEAARQLQEMADARDVAIRVSETMPTFSVDVGRLELVFINLLSNAVKYADPAKSARTVDVLGEVDGDGWCRLQVRDNGIGIPQQALGTVFRRFTRAHAHREDLEQVGGLGLGLSIVDDCVRAMGGQIELHSLEGIGTTFTISLPIAPKAG